MHPRNPYKHPLAFVSLAECYPPLKPFIIAGPHGHTIDFKSDEAQRHLTSALLHRDFSLKISLPPDRLCPPVPNRLNYILWIQDIIAQSTIPTSKHVWGIDVGTGASAIYPLLACSIDANWMFVATDVDEYSLACAKSNVVCNDMQTRIHVARAPSASQILFPLSTKFTIGPSSTESVRFDFTMCNPPFYSSRDEVEKSARGKELAPNAVCTGADVEMITPGGEGSFVSRMVQESMTHRERCRWYTSMLGKMSTLFQVVDLLREHHIDNYVVTEFVQGKTRRWAIGWSFGDERLPDIISRISNPAVQSVMPPRNTLRQPVNLAPRDILVKVKRVLNSIESVSCVREIEDPEGGFELIVQTSGNTWSRSARRKMASRMESDEERSTNNSVPLQSRLTCSGVALEFCWVKGRDRSLFESFVSHVFRKMVS